MLNEAQKGIIAKAIQIRQNRGEELSDIVSDYSRLTDDEIDTITTPQSKYTLSELQEYIQRRNKLALSDFLKNNPILWIDGEYYGVTKEDQDEMITDKAAYDLKQAMGFTDWKLEWHNIKKSCREFSVEEFLGLLNAIVDFVYPYRKLQESYKEMIYSAETKEDVMAIELSYKIENEE